METEDKSFAPLIWGPVLLAIVLLFFYPAFSKTFIFRDCFNLFYPYKAFEADYLRAFSVCTWNPFETLGSSFLGELSPGWFYPANVLYMVFSVDTAFRIFIVGHYLLAAAFMWLLLREIKVEGPAAVCGALCFTLSGYVLSQNGMPDMLVTSAWLPGCLFFLVRYMRSGLILWLFLLGASIFMPLIAGKAEGVIVLGMAATGWIVISDEAGSGIKDKAITFVKIMPIAGVVGLIVAMVQFLPSYELGKLSMKGEGFPIDIATLWSFHPKRLIEFILSSPWGRFWPEVDYKALSLTGWEGHYPWTISQYMGIPILIGAAIALVRATWKQRLLVGGSLLIALFFSMGGHFFLYPLVHRLFPFFRIFRYPEKYMVIVVLILAAAGAFGLNIIIDYFGRSKGRRFLPGVGILLIALISFDLFYSNHWIIPYSDTEIYNFEPEALSVIRKHSRTHGLGYFDEKGNSRLGRFRVMREPMEGPGDAIGTIEGGYRFERYRRWERHTLLPNFNFLLGIEELAGYTAAPTADFYNVMRSHLTRKTMALFNVRYVIGPVAGLGLKSGELPLVAARYSHGFKVFEIPEVFPRSYLIGRGLRVKNSMEDLSLLDSHDFKKAVVLDEAPGLPAVDEESDIGIVPAEIVSYDPEEVKIKFHAHAPSYLVLSDSFFPGWEAYIDGEPTPIFKANYLVRAIWVPAGEHEAVFVHRPGSYLAGRAITVIGLLLALAIVIVDAFRRRGQEGRSN